MSYTACAFGYILITVVKMLSHNQNDNHNHNHNIVDDHNQANASSANPSIVPIHSLIPTTIKQILNSPPPGPDQVFSIDGKLVHQVSIIGTIAQMAYHNSSADFYIDDQACKLKCKLWCSDDDDIKERHSDKLKQGDLVKVIGKVGILQNSRTVTIHHIERISNFNDIALHGLEVILAHELNPLLLNQHLPTQKGTYEKWIARAKHEEFEYRKAVEEYKKSKEKAYQQSKKSVQRNQNSNLNHNRNWNQNSQNNQINTFQVHENNTIYNNLTEWERRIVQWMRINVESVAGLSREIIKKKTGCTNEVVFGKSLDVLVKKGYITDTFEDKYAVVPSENVDGVF